MKLKSTKEMLYAFLDSTVKPVKEDILISFDDIYNVTEEDRKADREYEYSLSELLYFAADVCFEVEAEKNENDKSVPA